MQGHVAATPDAEYLVDAEARYVVSEPVVIESAVQLEFAERVGVMAVYPFLRASLLDLSTRLGAGRAVLPIIRGGNLKLHPNDEDPPSD
ncbi:hypothetical protein BH24ACT4_BH24ACT4_02800 [soil metagenome]